MGIKVVGLNKLKLKLKGISDVDDKTMLRMAAFASDEIKQHTLKGQDENGRIFTPYAKGSKKAGQRVQLNDRGSMFSAMIFKMAGKNRSAIFFTQTKEAIKAAVHHYGLGHMPARKWFGLQKSEKKKMLAILEKDTAAKLK